MKILNSKKCLAVVFIFVCGFTVAQNKPDVDTISIHNFSLPPEVFHDYELSTSFFPEIYRLSLFNKFLEDTSNVWIRTRMITGFLNNEDQKITANNASQLLNPLYNKFLENQKYSTLYSILGSVQVGAVAYMAYKHIKKYGFLKKK